MSAAMKMDACPFCGTQPQLVHATLDERFAYADHVRVFCNECGASQSATGDTSKPGYADNSTTEQRAIAAWNRRTPPQGELSALPELPKPIGYAQKQPLLEYAPCTMLYSAKPVPENGHECVALFSEDQVRDLLCRQSSPWNPTDKELVQMQEDARDAMLWRQSGDAADKRDAALDALAAQFSQPYMEYFGSDIQDAIKALKAKG